MKSLKLSLAVLIVALGQGNIFSYNYSFLLHELQNLTEKTNKKLSATEADKQRVSRLPSQKNLNLKILQIRENQANQNHSIILAAVNLGSDLISNRQFDFRQIKKIWPIWFGCCGNSNNYLGIIFWRAQELPEAIA